MQLIKDKAIVTDHWTFVADGDELATGDVVVSLARFKQEKAVLLNRSGMLGIRLQPADAVAELANDLTKLALIELNFPDFADGRAFSQAWLLRQRYGYTGEIRAVGHYLTDQLFYLSRVGVNAFVPSTSEDLSLTLTKLTDFSMHYQYSVN